MSKLNQALASCLLFAAILIGVRILQLLSQLEDDLAEVRVSIDTSAAQLQLTLQSAQAVLTSVRATTEAVRRRSNSQLGYYEAIGHRTSQLLAETTLLVRHTDQKLERLTSSTESLHQDLRSEVTHLGSVLETSANSTKETLTAISSVANQAGASLAHVDLPTTHTWPAPQ